MRSAPPETTIIARSAPAWSAWLVGAAAAAFGVACEGAPEIIGTNEEQVLPNDGVFERDHDGKGYRAIAEYWRSRGLDMTLRRDRLDVGWPLRGDATAVLNRFGTPQLLGSFEAIGNPWSTTFPPIGYYHTALDVVRSGPDASDDVLAPTSGLAMVFDWNGQPGRGPYDYATVVSIYDPESHVIVELMHVAPDAALPGAGEPFTVRKGDVIGKLAKVPIDTPRESAFRHAHLDLVDGAALVLLDPASVVRSYRDSVPPTAASIYLLDEAGQRKDALVTGRLDVVVDAFDRDDDSNRNLEPASIAFEIRDGAGNTLLAQPRCRLADLVDSLAVPYPFRAVELVDFGNARGQMDDAWPHSDIGNPERRFRYALTQLAVQGGRCTVLDDADGHVDVSDAVDRLDVHVTLWDPVGNVSDATYTLARDPRSNDGPRTLVTFEVSNATTVWGQSVFVVGDAPQLGGWNVRRAVKLSPVAYPTWRGTAWLPVGVTAAFKFIEKDAHGGVVWEAGGDRTYLVPSTPDPEYAGTWR
jgi:hypothetical protein